MVGGAPKGHPLAPLFAHIINFKGILDFLSRKIKNYQACILTLSESCLWELQEIIHSEKSEVLRSNQFHLFSWQLVIWGLKASIEKVCCSCVFGCYSYTSLLNICSIISTGFLITSLQKNGEDSCAWLLVPPGPYLESSNSYSRTCSSN